MVAMNHWGRSLPPPKKAQVADMMPLLQMLVLGREIVGLSAYEAER